MVSNCFFINMLFTCIHSFYFSFQSRELYCMKTLNYFIELVERLFGYKS